MFDLFGMIREKGVKMISKELLSEVLKIEIIEILGIDNKNDLVYRIMQEYRCESGYESKPVGTFINIYELSHKCKEWAWDKGYGFESLPFAEKIFNRFNASDLMSFSYSNEDRKDRIPYKVKYLFKACQWILDNKED